MPQHLHGRGMAEQRVILVAGKLFGGEFPVTIDGPLLYATDDFGAAFTTIQHTVEIPCDIAEIIAQRRRGGIPVAENQSLVALYARNFVQPPSAICTALAGRRAVPAGRRSDRR